MRKLVRPATILALACMAVALHAASNNIREDVDPSSGLKTLYLIDVHTHNCPGVSSVSADLKLIFMAQQTPEKEVIYSLSPALTSRARINIRRGDTMDTLTDGNPAQLVAPINELQRREHAYRRIDVKETVPFPMTRDQLTTLSKAELFQFTINGKNNSVQRCVSAKDLKDLAEFLGAAGEY
jgi:hypothetical protein